MRENGADTRAATPSRVGRLHVITDETLQDRLGHAALAALALEGGAEAVQLREKHPRSTAQLVAVARAIAALCADRHALCIVNDRADVAFAARSGVHVGQDDLAPADARALLGPHAVVGATVHDDDELRAIEGSHADYLGVGPVFGTTSKETGLPALGLDGLERFVRATRLPVIAIGGITPERVAAVLATGAHGVAVLGGVCLASDPRAATARYREAIERALAGGSAR